MKWLILGGILALFVAGGVGAGLGLVASDRADAVAYRGSQPPGRIELPEFALRDEQSVLVRSREFRGKVVALTFLDSQCTESCPIIASQIARTLEELTAAERRELVAVAISTDPAEDTRESVHGFLRRNRALGKLRYLGGGEPVEALRAVWKEFAILSSFESGEDTLHSAPVRVYDREGVWVSTLHAGADLTPASLAHDIRLALDQ
ncbi:MAG: SCO family protein [Gaiellaceae bacterium]